MGDAVTETHQYFVGIAGEQTGPYSEDDLVARIRARQIPEDSLVWYEGLPDWQPIIGFEPFRIAFADAIAAVAGAPPPPAPSLSTPLAASLSMQGIEADAPAVEQVMPSGAAARRKARRRAREAGEGEDARHPRDQIASFAAGDDSLEPAFKDGKKGGRKRSVFLLLGFGFAAVVAGGIAFVESGGMALLPQLGGGDEGAVEEVGTAKAKKALQDGAAKRASVELEAVQTELRKAQSELLLNPEASLLTLRKILAKYPTDKVGKDALEAAVTYYKQTQRPSDAGKLLMEAKQPAEAAKFFLSDPPSYAEADGALFAAYQATKEPARRELLLKDIELLLGVLAKPETAVERIKVLEADFPGEKHPYAYYLKSVDEKIADLFSRISFHFVQSLLQYLSTEFPQLGLTARPLVEVVKEKSGGTYRIVGRYKGEVVLNRDRMPSVFFTFWTTNESWALVDTNLTPERKRFAAAERERHKDKGLTGDALLEYLQTLFRQKFPKAGLHETVSETQAKAVKDAVE